jgi:hypothetical protein
MRGSGLLQPSTAEIAYASKNRAGPMVALARAVGWCYRLAVPTDPVVAANVRWLAGYRHPRNRGRPDLAAAAQVLIGDPASGLSHAADRALWRHVSAHARGDEMALPQVRRATAALAQRRLRLPDSAMGRRLRAALDTYTTTWNTTRDDGA